MSSILAVGSVAYDTVETPMGSYEERLAGSATYFSLAAAHFVPVSVVAAVGEDFQQEDLDLLANNDVDISGVERMPGKTFRWAGKYSDDFNERWSLRTELGVFAEFNPKIPESQRKIPYLFLGNIDPGLQRQVCETVARPKLVACDTMDFWIKGQAESLAATLKMVDLLMINDSEARLLSGKVNLASAAAAIRQMGPDGLIVKRGEYGAAIFGPGFTGAIPALFLEDVVDPTGAGDSFAGGLLGCLAALDRVDEEAMKLAVAAGTVMASFTVQGFSVDGLLKADAGAIQKRNKDLARLVGGRAGTLPIRS